MKQACLLLGALLGLAAAAHIAVSPPEVTQHGTTPMTVDVFWEPAYGTLPLGYIVNFGTSPTNMTGTVIVANGTYETTAPLLSLFTASELTNNWIFVTITSTFSTTQVTSNPTAVYLTATSGVCGDALHVPSLPAAVIGVTNATEKGPKPPGCSGGHFAAGIVWIVLTGNDKQLTLQSCVNNHFDTVIFVYDKTSCQPKEGNCVTGNDRNSLCGESALVTFTAANNKDYLVAFGGYEHHHGPFSLQIGYGTPPKQVPHNIVVESITTASIAFSWTGVSGSSIVYEIHLNNNTKTFTTADTYYEITQLTAGTDYTFYIDAINSAGEGPPSEIVAVTTNGIGNVNCQTAEVFSDALPFEHVGTVAGAPAPGGETSCGQMHYDFSHAVWYEWKAPANQEVVFDTCSPQTTFDTVLDVYTGDCASSTTTELVCVSQDDDTCASGTGSAVSFVAEKGKTYYILVSSYGFVKASDLFILTAAAAVAPPTVDNVVLLSLSPYSAELQFNLPANLRYVSQVFVEAIDTNTGVVVSNQTLGYFDAGVTAFAFQMSGLAPQTTYTFSFVLFDLTGNSPAAITHSYTTLALIPGSGCDDAIPAALYTRVAGTTYGLSLNENFNNTLSCAVPYSLQGRWYSVAGVDGLMSIHVCGNGAGNAVATVLIGSTCSQLSCVAMSLPSTSQACPFGSTVNWMGSKGTTYYVLVQGEYGNACSYVMHVNATLGAPSSCTDAILVDTSLPSSIFLPAIGSTSSLPKCSGITPSPTIPQLWFYSSEWKGSPVLDINTCGQLTSFGAQLVMYKAQGCGHTKQCVASSSTADSQCALSAPAKTLTTPTTTIANKDKVYLVVTSATAVSDLDTVVLNINTTVPSPVTVHCEPMNSISQSAQAFCWWNPSPHGYPTVTSYTLMVEAADDKTPTVPIPVGLTPSYLAGGLELYSTYHVAVVAFGIAGESAANWTTFTTPADVPEPPSSPLFSEITSESALMTFYSPAYTGGVPAADIKYTLTYFSKEKGSKAHTITGLKVKVKNPGSNTLKYTFNITGLSPQTRYATQLFSVTVGGTSIANGADFQTAPPPDYIAKIAPGKVYGIVFGSIAAAILLGSVFVFVVVKKRGGGGSYALVDDDNEVPSKQKLKNFKGYGTINSGDVVDNPEGADLVV